MSCFRFMKSLSSLGNHFSKDNQRCIAFLVVTMGWAYLPWSGQFLPHSNAALHRGPTRTFTSEASQIAMTPTPHIPLHG